MKTRLKVENNPVMKLGQLLEVLRPQGGGGAGGGGARSKYIYFCWYVFFIYLKE